MIRKRNVFIFFVWIIILVFTVSCSEDKKTELIPKDADDQQVILNQTETITVDSVQVTVSSDAWVGAPEVKTKVTPLKLQIKNNNDSPIKITYSNLFLVSNDGDIYSALPIYNIINDANKPHLLDDEKVVVKTEIDHDNFYLYPLYTRVYNDIPVTDFNYFEDPGYYEKYYAEWRETGMPTDGMKNLALPEGILDKGGSLSGFIYFQKVDPDLKTVTLNMSITNAENNEVLGSIKLPFWVMPEMEE